MRVSATMLEAFRRYMEPEQTWMPEAELIATIRGEFAGNRRTDLGSAYPAVIEDPDRYRVPNGYVVRQLCEQCDEGVVERESVTDHSEAERVPCPACGGSGVIGPVFSFDDAVMAPALAHVDRRGFFELKASIELDGWTLVAKADHLAGTRITEFKTTTGSFDADKYLASYQWRVMGLVFEPSAIVYHVAEVTDSPTGVVTLRNTHELTVYPYPAMRQDVRALLAEFGEYVRLRGLDQFLAGRLCRRVVEAADRDAQRS